MNFVLAVLVVVSEQHDEDEEEKEEDEDPSKSSIWASSGGEKSGLGGIGGMELLGSDLCLGGRGMSL